jgi:hypothetical protein
MGHEELKRAQVPLRSFCRRHPCQGAAAKLDRLAFPVAPGAAISDDNRKIKLLVDENPKRGKSRDRFALYRTGLTVEQYVERSVKAGNPVSLARADLRWDESKKLIAIAAR